MCYVYCDESHIDGHAYRVQGGIWVPESGLRAVQSEFAALRRKHPQTGEMKWQKVRGKRPGPIYTDLIKLFFDSPVSQLLSFNCMVVAQTDDISAGDGVEGRAKGFYKAYYFLLKNRLNKTSAHHLRIDEKGAQCGRHTADLHQCLRAVSARDNLGFVVETCIPVKSHNEDLVQLADVLCGAVGWAWNGMQSECGAKPLLHQQIRSYLPSWTTQPYKTVKGATKFNAWKFTPVKTKRVAALAA